MNDSIQLQLKSILHVPLNKYEKDFTFIVNGERFQTSHFIADLLSPIISKYRFDDPTFHEFYISTQSKGDFQQFLNLINFEPQKITKLNQDYFFEILEKLGSK